MTYPVEDALSITSSICVVSGGFDPIHSGHIRLIREAANNGYVTIILNSDNWLRRKKGYVFMAWEERAEILRSIKGVKNVVAVDDSDGTVCEALRRINPDYFANGGDRTQENTPEQAVCEELGIEMLWGVGGGKIASSSKLVRSIMGIGRGVSLLNTAHPSGKPVSEDLNISAEALTHAEFDDEDMTVTFPAVMQPIFGESILIQEQKIGEKYKIWFPDEYEDTVADYADNKEEIINSISKWVNRNYV